MKPTIARDLTRANLAEFLDGDRERVYRALQQHGPATTRELANRSGIDLLNVRPRITDLVDVGLATCIGRTRANGTARAVEGIYQAISTETALSAAHELRQAQPEQALMHMET
jgi:predicted transcriptional regulator